MIDTGSTENYIPEHIARKTQLNIDDLEENKEVETANGTTVTIKQFYDLKFKIANDENILYHSRFLLLPNPGDVFILGMRFLSENEAVINLKEGIINLDGVEYEIGFKTQNNNFSDNQLI
ncbi:hypothetical protein DMUE_5868 [Dictyocoela muelleri]|nr:hypothetical protein DMUE_5868 [Dictyocoela muelleri]